MKLNVLVPPFLSTASTSIVYVPSAEPSVGSETVSPQVMVSLSSSVWMPGTTILSGPTRRMVERSRSIPFPLLSIKSADTCVNAFTNALSGGSTDKTSGSKSVGSSTRLNVSWYAYPFAPPAMSASSFPALSQMVIPTEYVPGSSSAGKLNVMVSSPSCPLIISSADTPVSVMLAIVSAKLIPLPAPSVAWITIWFSAVTTASSAGVVDNMVTT